MNIHAALDAYLQQLAADGRSAHTIRQRARHVRLLAAVVGADRAIGSVDHAEVAKFLASPTAQRRADGGIRKATSANALRSSIKTFLTYAHDAGLAAQNAGRLIKPARCGQPLPKTLTADEQTRLLAAVAAGRDPEARRDHALLVVLLGAGLRLGSALGLDIADVDFARATIRLRHAKGDRDELLPIAAKVCAALETVVGNQKDGPVFRARNGARLGIRQAHRRIADWARAAGIERAVSPHAMRHSFATAVYERTKDLNVTARALCHRSLDSTKIYARVSDERLRAAVDA